MIPIVAIAGMAAGIKALETGHPLLWGLCAVCLWICVDWAARQDQP